MRKIFPILFLTILTGGCPNYSTPPAVQKQQTVSQRNFAAVWEASRDVLREYGFALDREDRRAGIITTLPLTGKHWFEFWRKDAAGGYNLAEGTIQTIYRVVNISIVPADGEKNRFVATVDVQTYRSDKDVLQLTSTSEAYNLFILPGDEYGRGKMVMEYAEEDELEEAKPLEDEDETPGKYVELKDVSHKWMVPLGADEKLQTRLASAIADRASEYTISLR